MNQSKILVKLIPINLVLSLMLMVYFYNTVYPDSQDYFVAESILISLLMLLGSGFYLYSAKQKVDIYFYLVLNITTWLLMLILGENEFFYRSSRVLMSIAPIALFVFVAHFTYLTHSPYYKKLLRFLVGCGCFTLIALQTFIFVLNYTFYLLILISIVCIAILSKKSATVQRPFYRNYQKYILIAVFIAFVPFIVTRSFEPFMTVKWLVQFSHHTFIVLPATVGYVLLKRSELFLEMDYTFMFYLIFFHIGIWSMVVVVMIFCANMKLMDALIVMLTLSIASLLYSLLKKKLEKKQLLVINKAKESFEKERLDILQSVTYDNYLESLSDLIEQLILNTVAVNGILLIWSENDKKFVFHQSGLFNEVGITPDFIEQLNDNKNYVEINDKNFLTFPLMYENLLLGHLILGDKLDDYHYTEVEIEKIKHLAMTVSEILRTTEILNKNQSRYLKLSQLQYDDQFRINMVAKSDDLRKSLSHYLHDDVLQTVLAVKNLIELIETDQDDIKSLVLTNMTQLNDSIRNQMFELYPSTLSDLTLYQSLSVLCDRFQSRFPKESNVQIKLTFDDDVDVPNALKFPLFRMIKELLHNAIKHAHAELIEVKVLYDAKQDLLYLSVADDGIGIDFHALEDAKNNNHIGLFSLKQEVGLLNGELIIQKRRTKGTLIQLKVPLKPSQLI